MTVNSLSSFLLVPVKRLYVLRGIGSPTYSTSHKFRETLKPTKATEIGSEPVVPRQTNGPRRPITFLGPRPVKAGEGA